MLGATRAPGCPAQDLILLCHHHPPSPFPSTPPPPIIDSPSRSFQYLSTVLSLFEQPPEPFWKAINRNQRNTLSMPGLSSAAGLIGLLDEPDQQLRCYALQKLDELVNQFWPEIAESVSKMFVETSSASAHVLASGADGFIR